MRCREMRERQGARFRARASADLHEDTPTEKETSSSDSAHALAEKQETAAHCSSLALANTSSSGATVLLATARIILADADGNSLSVKALIDPAAECSFIAERVLSAFTVVRRPIAVSVVGVGAESSIRASAQVRLILRSLVDQDFHLNISALVLPKLTRQLPQRTIVHRNWHHLQEIQLADPEWYRSSRVDCILGADVYPALIREGLQGPFGTPVAQNSVFGWILTGSISIGDASRSVVRVHHTFVEPTLSHILQKFWEMEEIRGDRILTPGEEACENLFKSTHFRDKEGRFVVRLPFKQKPNFVGSRDIAVACFLRLEKRLSNNPQLANQYADFLKEYESLGHMSACSEPSTRKEGYYLPHHAVVRPKNPKKIRVVFNASQRAANGVALNDVLWPGPKLQLDISIVITIWRFFRVAFCTDIVKNFRQIRVHPDDRKWQRIVWRPDEGQPLQDYEAETVTYGTTPAPYLALRSLHQLAEDGKDVYPEAARALKEKLYVDDVYEGADDLKIAETRRDQLIELLATACIPLDKWASNEPQLLHGISTAERSEVPLPFDEVVSALGVKWLPILDLFIFRFTKVTSTAITTKRSILSEISRLFDPLGWVAPIIIVAKIILQDLWISKAEWDTPVDDTLLQRWTSFTAELYQTSEIRIPHWLGGTENEEWELHGFADASKRAYAACVYYVSRGRSPKLLMAKTRVAPTKAETLPRLELCGTVLLVRLANHLIKQIQHPPNAMHFWSDSKVVLDWIAADPSKWNTFVANRTSEILTTFPSAQWRHVRSQDNPAHCATRGLSPKQLADHALWWEGPQWLASRDEEWNQLPKEPPASQELQALVAQEAASPQLGSEEDSDCLPSQIIFSKFSKCINVLAYAWRWRLNSKVERGQRPSTHCTVLELDSARRSCFKAIQLHHLAEEYETLAANQRLNARSRLIRLSPFLCDNGLLRVGGRLDNAPLPFDERHPIMLPRRCAMLRRLVEDAHRRTLHGGVQLMRSFLHRSVWIDNGQSLFQSVLRRCTVCARFGARGLCQQMVPLPAVRLSPSRAFNTAGLDYAGPFPVLFSKARGAKSTKGYVAIFISMVVHAVHIEIVTDLSTGAFLAVYDRFSSRRGLSAVLYSEDATTFKGASAELAALFKPSSSFAGQVTKNLAVQGTEWKFIPPRAPHFGGLWEAAVKSFKHHFKRVIGEATLTYEELSTLATKIEACLNSRPLCPLSSNGDDEVALTPAHFLVGTSLLARPEPVEDPPRPSRLNNRWRLVTSMHQAFWDRWRKEALHHLQQRNKWLVPQTNLKEGDIVIIKDELSPPTRWPLGRVIEVHPGKDGLVRVATIKTATSSFKRAIERLILLPTDDAVVRFYEKNNHSASAAED